MAPRFLPAISTMSLGRAWHHEFPGKIATAHKYGIKGVEIFYEDLEYHARSLHPQLSKDAPIPAAALMDAASHIHLLCTQYSLEILCLQPFMQFGGIIDRDVHARRIEEMRLWIDLAHTLGTDIIAVPASFLPPSQCSSDLDLIVSDLRQVADMGLAAEPPLRFVYESLCWATWSDVWEKSWEIVQRVDRPNFGLCLDTYNIAGRVYADPTSPTGKTPNAEADMKASIERLRTSVPVEKIFLLQLVDGERLDKPLLEDHPWYNPDQPARMSWSRNARCFPFEEDRGAYLPVMDILKAITDKETGIGYEGYISFELFSRTMGETGDQVPEQHATRAMRSWKKVCEYMGWDEDVEDIPTNPSTPVAALSSGTSVSSEQPELEDICDKEGNATVKDDSGIFVSVVEDDSLSNQPSLEINAVHIDNK